MCGFFVPNLASLPHLPLRPFRLASPRPARFGSPPMKLRSRLIILAAFIAGGALSLVAFAWLWRRRASVAASLETDPSAARRASV